MIAQAGLPALYVPPRPARYTSFCWQSIALVAAQYRHLAFPLKFSVGALAWVLLTSGTIEEPVVDREEAKLEITQLATARNETVVYQSAPATECGSRLFTTLIYGADRGIGPARG
jgi:hypothetical protein